MGCVTPILLRGLHSERVVWGVGVLAVLPAGSVDASRFGGLGETQSFERAHRMRDLSVGAIFS